MKYFKNVNNLCELRKQYKDLLKKYHPDNLGGDLATTQEINAEYEKLFKKLKSDFEHQEKSNGNHKENYKESYTYKQYDFTEDLKLREILEKIIHLDLNIEIIGNWIWVSGNTKEFKESLKELGFRWASEKKMWYFHTEAFRKKSYNHLSINDIRNYYGSSKVNQTKNNKEKELLAEK